MSGGGPASPRLPWVPTNSGAKSFIVSECARTMCGVSSMTMSVWTISLSFDANRSLRIGIVGDARESFDRLALVLPQEAREQVRFAVPQPQSRLDLPREERREILAGDVLVGPLGADLERDFEDDVAVVGDARLDVEVHAHVPVGERRERRRRDAPLPRRTGCRTWSTGTGSSSPSLSESFSPSAPRRLGLAMTFVSESCSRNRTTADGTERVEVRRADAGRDRVQVEDARGRVSVSGLLSGENATPT